LGLVISIPLVVFGATLLTWLLDRLPVLVWAGSALLGWVAGELIATEPILQPYDGGRNAGVTPRFITRTVEVAGGILVVLIGWLVLKVSRGRRGAHQAAE
jgi:predicted tellurium resistance membrane protein TerC